MSEGEYDNTNKGAGWPVDSIVAAKTLRIQADINGNQYYGVLIRTSTKSPRAPSHELFLRAAEGKEAYAIAIFRNDRGGAKLAGGEVTLRSGDAYWVSLFRNKSENPKSPALDLSFQEKEPQTQPDGEEEPVSEADNIPF